MAKPVIAIVGRPNVGKSTLFNRLSKKRVSIVEDHPGVTRDRIYVDSEWLGHEFTMIDTGGIEMGSDDVILSSMRRQAQLAMEEADAILFMVDGKQGLISADEEVAHLLRSTKKPVLLVVNKIDHFDHAMGIYDFYRLGLGDPIPISAANSLNFGDMLDELFKHLPSDSGNDYPDDVIKVALIGRPNVGKSSLVNSLLGEERVIVSDVPGTTRDAIDTPFEKDGQHYVIIDTAGIRRKSRIDLAVERYSVIRALRAIDRSDVVLMVIDAADGVTEQDKRIAGYAHEAGRACVIVVNKWDLVEKDTNTAKHFTDTIRNELIFLDYAPVSFVSALTKQRVHKLTDFIHNVAQQHTMRVSTALLNSVIEEALAINPPPNFRGRQLKVYYVTQVGVKPPHIVCFVNHEEYMHFSYVRYLENKLREAFSFEGTPLKLSVRSRKDKDKDE